MLLTPTEAKYIEIVSTKIRDKLTIPQIAEQMDIGESTVSKAIRWGKKHQMFNLAASDKLRPAILALTKHLDFLEKQKRLQEKAHTYIDKETGKKIRKPLPVSFLSVYSREKRETMFQMLELEGVYKRTLNVDLDAKITQTVQIYLPDNGRHGAN